MTGVSEAADEAKTESRRPDVTVVVIGYNDAERLPTAVASVLDQTLANIECIIVDDASTDGTADVARALAGGHPDRVRAVVLPENSGGCSRPRNVGIDAARAPWVMFLDSDDELERHAAKNLLLAGEAESADVVSGLCVRINLSRDNLRTPWFAELYRNRAAFDSIRDHPDLLFDTLCTNKLYRREFLDDNDIRFPEGLHYEDLLFTTEAYCSARRLALIPNEVYRWNVAEGSASKSITRQRADMQNFRDRITIHQRIDAYLDEHGFADLRPYKDRKFLLQDLKLYVGDLRKRDDDYHREWIAVAGDYLRTLAPEALAMVGPLPRAAAYLVCHGDVAATLDVADLWVRGNLAGDLVIEQGRAFVRSDLLGTDEAKQALDITSLHLHTAPFSRQNLLNTMVAITPEGDGVRIDGEINNLLGRIRPEDAPALTLILRSRDGRNQLRLGTTTVSVTPTRLHWSTIVRPTKELARLDRTVPVWDLWTQIDLHGKQNLTRLVAVPGRVPLKPVPLTGRRPWGQRFLRLRANLEWDVVAREDQTGRLAKLSARVMRRAVKSGLYQELRALANAPNSRPVKSVAYRLVFRRLPLRRDTVVFESMLGRSYSDSPKYVYEELRRNGPAKRAVWSYDGDAAAWPQDAVLVRRDSWRYYYELARAGTWIDNQGFPAIARPRAETVYLQTWHGSPLKAMGFDQPELQLGPADKRREFTAAVARWTHFCVQSTFAEEAFDRAFRHRAENLRIGYPRNDPLLTANDAGVVKELRDRLELPEDRRIVLYAPTFRDYRRITRLPYALPFSLGRVSETVGDSCFLLIRPHYLDNLVIPPRFTNVARDVSRHHDMTELLLVADALITDYSSTMFDFALLRRPMLFYAYDLELYATSRGMYFDLEADAPGPVVSTEDELVEWLADPQRGHEAHAERYERFVERFCNYESGHAAAAAIRHVFGASR